MKMGVAYFDFGGYYFVFETKSVDWWNNHMEVLLSFVCSTMHIFLFFSSCGISDHFVWAHLLLLKLNRASEFALFTLMLTNRKWLNQVTGSELSGSQEVNSDLCTLTTADCNVNWDQIGKCLLQLRNFSFAFAQWSCWHIDNFMVSLLWIHIIIFVPFWKNT